VLVGTTFRSATTDGERVDLTLIAIERGPDDPDAATLSPPVQRVVHPASAGDRLHVR